MEHTSLTSQTIHAPCQVFGTDISFKSLKYFSRHPMSSKYSDLCCSSTSSSSEGEGVSSRNKRPVRGTTVASAATHIQTLLPPPNSNLPASLGCCLARHCRSHPRCFPWSSYLRFVLCSCSASSDIIAGSAVCLRVRSNTHTLRASTDVVAQPTENGCRRNIANHTSIKQCAFTMAISQNKVVNRLHLFPLIGSYPFI